jgi:hypothetical protein
MSLWAQRDDFEAFAKLQGHVMSQTALDDAWEDFTKFKGGMVDFHADRKTRCPHRYTQPKPEPLTDHAALYSLAEQAAYVKEHGEAATRELLANFGVKLGELKPKRPVEIAGSNNPYSDDFKGTEEERQARIRSLLASGTRLPTSLAKAAGKSITGQPLKAI